MRGSPFFDGVAQSEVAIAGEPARVPIFYYDGTATQAVFAARLGALRRLMPDPRFSPARLAPGLGAVAITCFEYRDTDIGPYNELAISVVLNEPWFLPNLPGLALVSSLRRRQLHAWVQHLPVTTEIARAGGVDFYNYPKFIAGIDFEESERRRTCRLSEGAEHILTLSGERIATPRAAGVPAVQPPVDGPPAAELGVQDQRDRDGRQPAARSRLAPAGRASPDRARAGRA